MKFLITSFFSFMLILQSVDLKATRAAFKDAAQDQDKVNAFFKDLESINKKDRVELVAYKGASIALMAKTAKTIKEKKDHFIEGAGLVEFAVERDSSNVEVRFVRLSIQQNTPKILKYQKNIESDKAFILQHYQTIKSTSLKTHIADYISQAKGFTDEEKSVILDL